MEESGFKVYKNFKTSQNVIDIYAVLPTNFGDFGVVVECNNYDKDFPVSIETIKHMENVADSIKASKIVIVSSSFFTDQAINYALKKNVKLVDRNDLLSLVKRHQKQSASQEDVEDEDDYYYRDNGYSDDSYYDDEPYGYQQDDYYDEGYQQDSYYQSEPYYDDYHYEEYDYYDDGDYDYNYDYDDYMMSQRESNPVVYQSSLYRQDYEVEEGYGIGSRISEFLENILNRRNKNVPQSSLGSQMYYNQQPSRNFFEVIRPYLGNSVVLIALVVVITYIISFIGGSILKVDHGIISGFQIFFALVLSFGFTFLFAERNRNFLIRGTVVFFISLIILIILILI